MRVLLVFCLGALCAACSKPKPRWNVLLISVDTLRADHLACYGYERPTSPNIDRLAREGLRFSAVESPRAKTTPAMCSLFTGRYPHEHGVRDLASPLDAKYELLAERFARSGYRTGAIIGNWVLGAKRSGLQRGFDLWIEEFPDVRGVPPHDAPQRTATSLTDGAFELLALGAASRAAGPQRTDSGVNRTVIDGEQPWFVWLHYMDPHGAYEPPTEHRIFHSPPQALPELSPNDDSKSATKRSVALYNVPPEALGANGQVSDVALVRDLYDGEIHYVDAQIGRLLDALRARGDLEHTLVVLTADHGESLGEQDYWFEHGRYAFESTSHVPLIVRFPDRSANRPPAGVRDANLSLAELAPTLSEWLGLAVGPEPQANALRGASRRALFDADDTSAHAVFYEKVERSDLAGSVQTKGVRLGQWKLLRRFAVRAKSNGEHQLVVLDDQFFDLSRDPLESRPLDVADASLGVPVESLRRELERFIAADVDFARAGEILRRQRETLERDDPQTAAELKKLGY